MDLDQLGLCVLGRVLHVGHEDVCLGIAIRDHIIYGKDVVAKGSTVHLDGLTKEVDGVIDWFFLKPLNFDHQKRLKLAKIKKNSIFHRKTSCTKVILTKQYKLTLFVMKETRINMHDYLTYPLAKYHVLYKIVVDCFLLNY